ncbi:MAG: signal peptidase I [Candidatus Gracilibacteria bacterium]|nr:signal peptidase I [Candidatus Gracilibacteria bacterium]
MNHHNQEVSQNYVTLEKQIDGDSMEPLLPNGSTILLLVDYYKTNTPKHGDIIAYHYGGNQHPLIKTIRAIPGDMVMLDIKGKTLIINGIPLVNSAGTPYIFTSGELQLLGLYTKTGTLPVGAYLVFGDNVTNSIDSRKFGAISADNFYGKFILKP